MGGVFSGATVLYVIEKSICVRLWMMLANQ